PTNLYDFNALAKAPPTTAGSAKDALSKNPEVPALRPDLKPPQYSPESCPSWNMEATDPPSQRVPPTAISGTPTGAPYPVEVAYTPAPATNPPAPATHLPYFVGSVSI